MKISGINFSKFNISTTNKITKPNKNNDYIKNLTVPSFGGINMPFDIFHKKDELPPEYKERTKQLEEEFEVTDFYAHRIANLDENGYQKAINLLNQFVSPRSAALIAAEDDDKYNKAQSLVGMGITDDTLSVLANNNDAIFARITDLRQKGLNADYLPLFIKLSDSQYKEAVDLITRGHQQNEAAYLVQLKGDQKSTFKKLLYDGTYINLAFDIAKQKRNIRNRAINYINQGYSPMNALEMAQLNHFARKRSEEKVPSSVGKSNMASFATLKGKHLKRAVELFNQGVLPEYIPDIILIERGRLINNDYNKYLEMGYSHSMAYAVSLLTDEELEGLKKIEEKFPEIKDLYKDNYDVSVLQNQIVENEDNQAVFSKDIRTNDGTTITIVKTFNEDGTMTNSRTEEYDDGSTSSYMQYGNRVIRAKYDKYEQLSEVLHILENEETGEVEGAIYSKASEVLPGTFDSVYYDISEFKQDNSSDEHAMDFDISKIVTGKGTQLSKSHINPDGSITFQEHYNTYDCATDREYNVIKDEQGNILESSYSYTITKDDGTVLMNILRRRETNRDGSVSDFINGLEYKIRFDDEKKTAEITDGERTKILDFSTILPFYSQKSIWQAIKNQPVDTLLTITENIDKWSYVNENDSQIYRLHNELCSGREISVIAHEAGHLTQKSNPDLCNNKAFLESYDMEMTNFATNFPFNEQEYVQYFMPNAELAGSIGYEEFISEVNMLLTTYGTPIPSITTRSQFLTRYFPNTIAIVADMLGKTSKESLLI